MLSFRYRPFTCRSLLDGAATRTPTVAFHARSRSFLSWRLMMKRFVRDGVPHAYRADNLDRVQIKAVKESEQALQAQVAGLSAELGEARGKASQLRAALDEAHVQTARFREVTSRGCTDSGRGSPGPPPSPSLERALPACAAKLS